jgi:hypothetical protein
MPQYGRRVESRVPRFSSINQIFVQNTGTVGGNPASLPATPDDVGEGEIVFFNGEGSAINLSTDTYSDHDEVILSTKIGGTVVQSSILTDKFDKLVAVPYAAPAAQVSDFTAPAAGGFEGYVSVKVTHRGSGGEPHDRVNASMYLYGTETATAIATKIQEELNNNPSSFFTVTRSGADLTITGEEPGLVFEVSLNGMPFQGTDVTLTTAPTYGNGSYEDVLVAEHAVRGTYGRYYQEDGLMGTVPYLDEVSQPGGQYDLYNLLHKNNQDDAINKSFAYQQILIAVEDAADTANLESFFGV